MDKAPLCLMTTQLRLGWTTWLLTQVKDIPSYNKKTQWPTNLRHSNVLVIKGSKNRVDLQEVVSSTWETEQSPKKDSRNQKGETWEHILRVCPCPQSASPRTRMDHGTLTEVQDRGQKRSKGEAWEHIPSVCPCPQCVSLRTKMDHETLTKIQDSSSWDNRD